MYTITIIFTCYNRKEKTINCVKSLSMHNFDCQFSYVILDDNSTDGTVEALNDLKEKENYDITILKGNGKSFWAGGMRRAMAYAKENMESDYFLMVNDDVCFFEKSIDNMLKEQQKINANTCVLVGPTCDEQQNYTYGGIRYTKGIKYQKAALGEPCDTFNMNCLLVPQEIFKNLPDFDKVYVHGLADFDYGLTMKRQQIKVIVASAFVGICNTNDTKGGWNDTALSRRERLRMKENPKGAPFGPWFHFLKKNFGIKEAIIRSITPYIRILFGK